MTDPETERARTPGGPLVPPGIFDTGALPVPQTRPVRPRDFSALTQPCVRMRGRPQYHPKPNWSPGFAEDTDPAPQPPLLNRARLRAHEADILAGLAPHFRPYYFLRFHHHRTYREIADHLKISEPLARKRVYQVRQFLKELLGERR
ncbi:RNA polymerase sigma factor [Roseibium sp.]|uniref:RNA polymerase sigma factor n=1 Tax=Roseibium sp. TaxID=1936156 RepID=UPI003B50E501